MGRRPRQIAARRGLMLAAVLALAGCATSNVQVSTGGPPVATAPGSSTFGTLLLIGFMAGLGYESYKDGVRYRANPFDAFSMSPPPPPPPPLDPTRRVLEQDCTQAIVDWSANLRCR